MEFLTEALKSKFTVTELLAGDAASMKVKPMNFKISHYDVGGIGHLVIMQGSAMLGLMKMDTIILTPTAKDAPLFSYDRIKAMGNDTYIIELYDTLINKSLGADYDVLKGEKEKLSAIADHDLGQHWYDPMKLPASFAKRGKKCADILDKNYESFFNGYLELLDAAPDCEKSVKNEKTLEYVNGLFNNGGPSTDAFVKGIGREAAEKLFKETIFGVAD